MFGEYLYNPRLLLNPTTKGADSQELTGATAPITDSTSIKNTSTAQGLLANINDAVEGVCRATRPLISSRELLHENIGMQTRIRLDVLNILSNILDKGFDHHALLPYLACIDVRTTGLSFERGGGIFEYNVQGTFSYANRKALFQTEEKWTRTFIEDALVVFQNSGRMATVSLARPRSVLISPRDIDSLRFLSRSAELIATGVDLRGHPARRCGERPWKGTPYAHLAPEKSLTIDFDVRLRSAVDGVEYSAVSSKERRVKSPIIILAGGETPLPEEVYMTTAPFEKDSIIPRRWRKQFRAIPFTLNFGYPGYEGTTVSCWNAKRWGGEGSSMLITAPNKTYNGSIVTKNSSRSFVLDLIAEDVVTLLTEMPQLEDLLEKTPATSQQFMSSDVRRQKTEKLKQYAITNGLFGIPTAI